MIQKIYRLNSDEQAIEDSLDEYVTIDNEEEMKKAIVEAAKAYRAFG